LVISYDSSTLDDIYMPCNIESKYIIHISPQ